MNMRPRLRLAARLTAALLPVLLAAACDDDNPVPDGNPVVNKVDVEKLENKHYKYHFIVRYAWPYTYHKPKNQLVSHPPYHVVNSIKCQAHYRTFSNTSGDATVDFAEFWKLDGTGHMPDKAKDHMVRDYADIAVVDECCAYSLQGVKITAGTEPGTAYTVAANAPTGVFKDKPFKTNPPKPDKNFKFEVIQGRKTDWSSWYRRTKDQQGTYHERLVVNGIDVPIDEGEPGVQAPDCAH